MISSGSKPGSSTPSNNRSPGTEQDWNDVENKLVHHARGERLADGGGAAGDVDPKPVGGWSNTASNPSVTKWNVVPPFISIGSCG